MGKINQFSFTRDAALMCDTSISGQTTKLLCQKRSTSGLPIEAAADATFVSAIWTGGGGQMTAANPVPEPAESIPVLVAAAGVAIFSRKIRISDSRVNIRRALGSGSDDAVSCPADTILVCSLTYRTPEEFEAECPD